MTICRVNRTPRIPKGMKPWCDQRLEKLAVWPRAPTLKKITARPATINTTMVRTLSRANQNSSSPYTLTASVLVPYRMANATSPGNHCGTSGNQKCTYTPIAVSSAIAVTTHMNQYDQPVTNPEKGLMNSSAYVANEPATGRYVSNSPSARIRKKIAIPPI